MIAAPASSSSAPIVIVVDAYNCIVCGFTRDGFTHITDKSGVYRRDDLLAASRVMEVVKLQSALTKISELYASTNTGLGNSRRDFQDPRSEHMYFTPFLNVKGTQNYVRPDGDFEFVFSDDEHEEGRMSTASASF